MVRRIKLEQHEKVPWLNGRGLSWNIAMDINHPDCETGQFGWRFATAKIDHSGAFSTYNNVDRIITLVRGNGFLLKWGESQNAKLTASKIGDPKLFPGDADTHCELIDGPVQVLNLMVDRDLWRAEGNTRTSGQALELTLLADVILLFTLQQTQTVEVDGEALELDALETVLLQPNGVVVQLKSLGELTQPVYIASLTKKGS